MKRSMLLVTLSVVGIGLLLVIGLYMMAIVGFLMPVSSAAWSGPVSQSPATVQPLIEAQEPGDSRASQLPPGQAPTVSGVIATGMGTVMGTPDIAFITVGVESNRATAQEAQQETAEKINAALAQVRAMGVQEKDIRTVGLSLSPVYADRQPGVITGYRASNELRIKVQDITKTGEILDAAVAAGANRGGQIKWGFKDDSRMRLDALSAAVKSAEEKAKAMAQAANVNLAGIESVEEVVSAPPAPVMRAAAPALDTSPVLPGEMTITAQVRIVYRLR